MKRNLIVPGVLAALLLLLLFLRTRRGTNTSRSEVFEATNSQAMVTPASTGVSVASPQGSAQPQKDEMPAGIPETELERIRREKAYVEQLHNQDHNVSVAFYGLVVDQDTNPLPNVTADLAVVEELPQPFPNEPTHRISRLQRKTGVDGRFEVTGLEGTSVEVYSLRKEGYEQEDPNRTYGGYGAQITSYISPQILRMWKTNLHEPLVTGDKLFTLIPDGRHYAIDLIKGTIAEGDQGDLIASIKRPEKVERGQTYDWSCELTIPAGGLLESQDQAMFRAPDIGYNNFFGLDEQQSVNNWAGCFQDKRFYVRLRDGQIYGRIVMSLYADFHRTRSGFVQLSYAVNPSGSRLLR